MQNKKMISHLHINMIMAMIHCDYGFIADGNYLMLQDD